MKIVKVAIVLGAFCANFTSSAQSFSLDSCDGTNCTQGLCLEAGARMGGGSIFKHNKASCDDLSGTKYRHYAIKAKWDNGFKSVCKKDSEKLFTCLYKPNH